MNGRIKETYLLKIQEESLHPALRFWISLFAVLFLCCDVGLAFFWAVAHPNALAFCALAFSVVLTVILWNLALLVVDIADMLIEQGTRQKGDDGGTRDAPDAPAGLGSPTRSNAS